jgi:hypothetical protein
VATSGAYSDLTGTPTIPSALSDLSDDSTHRTVTDTEKSTWNGKQDALSFDSTPTDSSTNPVTSNGVYDAVNGLKPANLNFIIDGGGSAITAGIKGDVVIPFACTITEVTLLADQSGSIVVDIWKDTYANFPPTDADSITSSAVPTISSATKYTGFYFIRLDDVHLCGDVLRFNVDSASTVQRVTLALKVVRA